MDNHPQIDDEPRTLRITATPWEEFQETALERVKAEDSERLVAFEDAVAIQRLLTPKRLELLRTVMETTPESMRGLAETLGRAPSEVHADVHRLEEYKIIRLEPAGRAKRPVVPYESIEIEVTLSLPEDNDDAAPTG